MIVKSKRGRKVKYLTLHYMEMAMRHDLLSSEDSYQEGDDPTPSLMCYRDYREIHEILAGDTHDG